MLVEFVKLVAQVMCSCIYRCMLYSESSVKVIFRITIILISLISHLFLFLAFGLIPFNFKEENLFSYEFPFFGLEFVNANIRNSIY